MNGLKPHLKRRTLVGKSVRRGLRVFAFTFQVCENSTAYQQDAWGGQMALDLPPQKKKEAGIETGWTYKEV
jgi:hypothetical protein